MTGDEGRTSRLAALYDRLGIHGVALALLVVGFFVSDEFLTGRNLLNVLNAVALLGIVAVGMAFVTYSGNMADLSLPAVMARHSRLPSSMWAPWPTRAGRGLMTRA